MTNKISTSDPVNPQVPVTYPQALINGLAKINFTRPTSKDMTLFPLKMGHGFESPTILYTGYMRVFDSFIVVRGIRLMHQLSWVGNFDEYMFYVGNRENQYGKKARICLLTYIGVNHDTSGGSIPICYNPSYCFGGFLIEPCINPAISDAFNRAIYSPHGNVC